DPSQTQPVVLDLNGYPVSVTVPGDLTLDNATISIQGSSRIDFSGATATLAGTGSVLFATDDHYNALRATATGGQLTIGANVAVMGFGGVLGYDSSYGGPTNVSVVNQGTIGPTQTGTIYIAGASFTNQGTLQAAGGGTLYAQTTTISNFNSGTLTGGTWK